MKRLIITEKKSVGETIAAVLGVKKRMNGYIEGEDSIISWCCGHLAGLASADVYNEKYAVWKRDDLPIVPSRWQFTLLPDKSEQFGVLRDLMNRDDVGEIVNACDAGREGELIFRTVYYMANCTKPMKRLWISSMEDEAIRDGFANLRPGSEYEGLYQSALCRAKADWLVGINATRLFSTAYHRTLNVGRVVSPTLALIVQREAEINAFKPENFYTVHADFDGFTAVSGRYSDKAEAEKAVDGCCNSKYIVKSVERREKSENPPLLYDLTTLQRDANRIFGYTAQQTLDYLQSLYEKKLCTYPRTDSRYLTDDMAGAIPAILAVVMAICDVTHPGEVYSSNVCDSKKVSDHHAIIPTMKSGEADTAVLPNGEREILRLVAKQFLRSVSGPFRYAETVVTLKCDGIQFTAKGKTVLEPGWRQYDEKESENITLPELKEGQQIIADEITVAEGKTTPLKHFTEDTLLSAMETAGLKDMPADAERKGLGTPATRAAILEKLITNGFVERKKLKKTVHLMPTHTGNSLITVLPEQLQSPLLTAEWENQLKKVEHGEIPADDFVDEITEMLRELTSTYDPVRGAEVLFPSGRAIIGKCPRCGGDVTESRKGFFCEHNECRFGIWRDNRFFTAKKVTLNKEIVSTLLNVGKIHLKGLYSEKTGKDYDAAIILKDDGKQVRFELEFEGRRVM